MPQLATITHRHYPLLPCAAVLLLASACATDPHPASFCAAPKSIAVEVSVTDSVSGAPMAMGTSGQLHGTASDSLVLVMGSSLLMDGGSRLGTYSLVLSHSGYADWHRTGILVTDTGSCGNVVPVAIDARLEAVP